MTTDTAGRELRAAAIDSVTEYLEHHFGHVSYPVWRDHAERIVILVSTLTDAASAAAGSNVPGEELTVEWAQEMVCVPVESIENVIDIAEFGRKRLDAGHYGAIIAACQVMLAAESAEASGDRSGV